MDVFAVGSDGTILHYDGRIWSPMMSGTARTLTSVWGSSGNDVFAVGWDGTILRYTGSFNPGGDVNNDKSVNVTDTILALQISLVMHPAAPVYKTADVDGNGTIDMAEAIYAIQVAAGLR